MRIIKYFAVLFTIITFVFSTTGCATTGVHNESGDVNRDKKEDSSINMKALAIGAGAVIVAGLLVFILANGASKGIGEGLANGIHPG